MQYVAILGAGPAALIAAQACSLAGQPFAIFTKYEGGEPVKSKLGGAQFVHRPLPGMHDEDKPDGVLRYKVVGSADGYRQKVYGNEPVPFVSMERVREGLEVPCWSLQKTYDTLWNGIVYTGSRTSANEANVDARLVQELLNDGAFKAVISTVPKHAICKTASHEPGTPYEPPHTFRAQRIHLINRSVLLQDPAQNVIVYDGTPYTSWYRTSLIFGHGSTEWGEGAAVPPYLKDDQVITATKPLFTNCTCWRDEPRVLMTGRYGDWRKGALVHDAFTETWELLQDMNGRVDVGPVQ